MKEKVGLNTKLKAKCKLNSTDTQLSLNRLRLYAFTPSVRPGNY
jgi:hypothetical protein